MPTRPPLHRPIANTKAQRDRDHDRRRSADQPWRHWYWTARWRRIAKAQLTEHPLCATCDREGRITAATVVNHKTAHRGDPSMFWDTANLESLCKRHHDSDAQIIDRGGSPRRVLPTSI